MADRSPIEWTEASWNPVRGCSRVSPGCVNCYAERVASRFCGKGKPFEGFATRTILGKPKWTGKVELIPELLDLPLRWRRPRRVFVNSMSDLFHESLPFEHIAAVFAVMALAPQHTFQILTKRAERALAYFRWVEAEGVRLGRAEGHAPWDGVNVCHHHADGMMRSDGPYRRRLEAVADDFPPEWPLPNVWLGVSVEDQQRANERIPLLLQTPAAVRWISAEPLLGPLELRAASKGWLDLTLGPEPHERPTRDTEPLELPQRPRLDWVVVGGESGPGARPCDVQWIRSVVTQCHQAGVPVFVKQLGADPWDVRGPDNRPVSVYCGDRKGGDMAEWPADLRVREWPK